MISNNEEALYSLPIFTLRIVPAVIEDGLVLLVLGEGEGGVFLLLGFREGEGGSQGMVSEPGSGLSPTRSQRQQDEGDQHCNVLVF